jgi:hypothetical protein
MWSGFRYYSCFQNELKRMQLITKVRLNFYDQVGIHHDTKKSFIIVNFKKTGLL